MAWIERLTRTIRHGDIDLDTRREMWGAIEELADRVKDDIAGDRAAWAIEDIKKKQRTQA